MTFDAASPGTPAAQWEADPRLHDRPALALDGVDELVVVGAHPDDETLGAGGLIAECAGRGIPVRVIVVTDGGAAGRPEMTRRRSEELHRAIRVLAPAATVHELGFEDGATRENRELIAERLHAHLAGCSANALIAAPWRGDGHRDHRVVGEQVVEVSRELGLRVVEYPIWLWHWGEPASAPWSSMRRLVVDAALKSRALAEFSSQREGDHPVLRADFLLNFARDEMFIDEQPALTGDYFDDLYARRSDPWGFDTRWYEARKRAVVLASLPEQRFASGLEIGCSIGHLTDVLAERCDTLLAIDVAQGAVDLARARVGDRATVRRHDVSGGLPEGEFDLIMLSEVGYYFDRRGLESVLDGMHERLAPGGTVVVCHWRHPVADYPLDGDEVHAAIGLRSWNRLVSHVERDFVLEVFSDDGRSVAARAGLA